MAQWTGAPDAGSPPGPAGSEEARKCRFPGCDRPAEPGDGRGRPPEYCDDPGHNRAAAFRRRRELGAAARGAPVADDAGEPVTMARARAGVLVERVETTIGSLSGQLTDILSELRTLGDPEAVEVELETVSASAEQRAAEARSQAAAAETRRRTAEAERVEADRLREEAEAAAEEALADAAAAREQADQHAHSAQTARTEAETAPRSRPLTSPPS
jgi:colicin import membrane protein